VLRRQVFHLNKPFEGIDHFCAIGLDFGNRPGKEEPRLRKPAVPGIDAGFPTSIIFRWLEGVSPSVSHSSAGSSSCGFAGGSAITSIFPGSGRCRCLASSHGAVSYKSTTSGVVRIVGIAFW
jgi:hypothetical protein